MAPCWCPLLHKPVPEDTKGQKSAQVVPGNCLAVSLSDRGLGPTPPPSSPLSYRKSSSLPALREKGAFRRELTLLHPRSAIRVSVCSLRNCTLPLDGKTAGEKGGGSQHHSGPAPLARGLTERRVSKAPVRRPGAALSSPACSCALLPGTGRPCGRVLAPPGCDRSWTAPSSP